MLSFNGTGWGKHALNTGKKQRSLAFDEASNRLYVGSQGDFGYFEANWRYVSLLEKIPVQFRDFDEVWNAHVLESNVYFCTFQGIYIYNGDSVSVIRRPDGFNRSFLAGNRLFTQSPSGELFEVKDTELISLPQYYTNQVVAGVIRTEAGYTVFYNSGKIEILNSKTQPASYVELSKALSGKFINHVLPIADGRVVIATQRAGLFIYNPLTNQVENISVSDGLISNACLKVYQDHSGNLWVGMQNGIALVDINSPLRLLNQNIELQGSGYEAFDVEEGTYYTTSNGVYFLPKNETRSKFLVGTEGPAYGLQLINNKLYAGHHTGLFLLEKGIAMRRATCDGLWQVKQLQSNPAYAIGGTYSGLYLFKLDVKGELQPVQKINGFNESSRFFEEDNKGRIWVGQYYKGLYLLILNQLFSEATVKKVSDSYSLPIQQYLFLSRIDDQLYISTAKGIFKLDQTRDTIVEETVFTKIVGDSWVYQLLQDKQKNVYVYSDNRVGLFKHISPGNYAYVSSSLFQLRQSFNNDLLHVSRNVSTGVLFNANEGFIHYNPALEEEASLTNEPLVSEIYSVAEDSSLYARMPFEPRAESEVSIQITEGTKVLQFIIESFKFKDVSNQQFRYYLAGFDEDYSGWTTSGVKEYTNLKVGQHL